MIVYRVESDAGMGPYYSDAWLAADMPLVSWDGHPSPSEDGILSHMWGCEHVFGFATIDQLRAWFGEYADALRDAGMLVTVYKVDREHVVRGHKQLCFDRHEAEHVDTLDLVEMCA